MEGAAKSNNKQKRKKKFASPKPLCESANHYTRVLKTVLWTRNFNTYCAHALPECKCVCVCNVVEGVVVVGVKGLKRASENEK